MLGSLRIFLYCDTFVLFVMTENQEEQFVKLISENQGLIHKVCLMYEREEESRKDLFQEVVLQLWRSYSSYKGDSKITTWMYRIALNTAISSFRKTSKQQLTTGIESLSVQPVYDNEYASRSEQFVLLEKAIGRLNDIEKALMTLYLDETPNEEIAETLGITPNHVRVKMSRIREKLKSILSNSHGT